MRVAATKEGDESKATTSKLFGNSSYGKEKVKNLFIYGFEKFLKTLKDL